MRGITDEEFKKIIPNPITAQDIYAYNILEQLFLLNGKFDKLLEALTKEDTPANQAMIAELKVVEEGGKLDADMSIKEEPKPKRSRKKKVEKDDV